ncbi:MAG: hypothetical protein GX811_06090, partial [Lentisphaerae bacterium]|nr:hypothetical protein [Lentisphaerota bacterium]
WHDSSSRIHNCYNSIGSWFQQGITGIKPDPAAVGFKKIIIEPTFPDGLKHASSEYDSVRGTIGVSWKKTKKWISVDIEIPVGSEARVLLPANESDLILESGKAIAMGNGIGKIRRRKKEAEITVKSGNFSFSISRET